MVGDRSLVASTIQPPLAAKGGSWCQWTASGPCGEAPFTYAAGRTKNLDRLKHSIAQGHGREQCLHLVLEDFLPGIVADFSSDT